MSRDVTRRSARPHVGRWRREANAARTRDQPAPTPDTIALVDGPRR